MKKLGKYCKSCGFKGNSDDYETGDTCPKCNLDDLEPLSIKLKFSLEYRSKAINQPNMQRLGNKNADKPISLYPLTFDEAISLLVKE